MRNPNKSLVSLSFLLAFTFMVSCGNSNEASKHSSFEENAVRPDKRQIDSSFPTNGNINSESTSQKNDSIEKIEFENFTYPLKVWRTVSEDIVPKSKNISLKDGKLELMDRYAQGNPEPVVFSISNISFLDITNDSKKDAVVTLVANPSPRGSFTCTYIYSLKQNKPSLIGSFETGTGAFGGLRRLYFENESLILEEYVGTETTAYCCPEEFLRTYYKWNGKKLLKTKSETLPNESKNVEFLGYF